MMRPWRHGGSAEYCLVRSHPALLLTRSNPLFLSITVGRLYYSNASSATLNSLTFLQLHFWLILGIPASCASSVLSIVLRLCACVRR